jgi:hypothetical protein
MLNETNSLDRLVNTSNSFEGTCLPPIPQNGYRVPTVTNFGVSRIEPCIGGAFVTFTWLQENLTPNDYLEIFIFNDYKKPMSSNQNVRDNWKGVPKQEPIISSHKTSGSPARIFVPTTIVLPMTAAIATRHSSGVLSDYDFLGETSFIVSPEWVKWREFTAGHSDIRNDEPNIYGLCDSTGGIVTINLPPISDVADGFPLTFKKINTHSFLVALNPRSQDSVGTLSPGIAYGFNGYNQTVFINACKSRNLWVLYTVF